MFITSTMWRRELRGGQRQWWKWPWVVPAIVLLVVAVQESIYPIAQVAEGTSLHDLLTLWPQLVLSAWITVMVTWSIARDRQPAQREMLAITLIDPRSLLMAKTFGPSFGAMVVMGGLALWRVFSVEGRLDAFLQGSEESALRVVAGSLLPLAVVAQGVLIPVFLATLAARFGAGTRWIPLAGVLAFITGWVVLLLVLKVGWIGWLVPPMGIALLLVWGLVLLDSQAIAGVVALGICVFAFKMGADYRVTQASAILLVLSPLAVAIVLMMGLESPAGLFAMAALAFWLGIEIAQRYLSDLRLRGQYTDMLLAFGIAPWLLLWWSWSKQGFRKVIFGRG